MHSAIGRAHSPDRIRNGFFLSAKVLDHLSGQEAAQALSCSQFIIGCAFPLPASSRFPMRFRLFT
jgi:hypothetical protein